MSIAAGRVVYETREAIAELFGAGDPLRVIFTLNATNHGNKVSVPGVLQGTTAKINAGDGDNLVIGDDGLIAIYTREVELATGSSFASDGSSTVPSATPSSALGNSISRSA